MPRSCAITRSKLWLNPRRFKKTFQLPDTGWMPHLTQSLCLNLADPLARNLKLPAYFLQRSAVAIHETESLFEDLPLTVGERFQHVLDLLFEQNDCSHVARVFGPPVLDEIAEIGFLALAY